VARHVGSTTRWAAILLLAAAFAFPLYWTATMAFKPAKDWSPPGETIWWPQRPTLDNFTSILGLREPPESPFLQQPTRSATRPIRNSLIAAGGGTALALLAGIPAAYAIARFRAGGRLLPLAILTPRLFPPLVFLTPLFFLWVYVGMWDTLRGLVILYGAFTFPFAVWLMRSLFLEVPREISEAAIVDGCTHWGAFFKAVLPQVRGGLAATALFVFILSWSDFLIAAVMTGRDAMTAPVFLSFLQGDEFERQFGPQAALSLILILPPAILAVALRRYLVLGLTLGAVRR
jgi:multiple sugar transport system permease protein